MSLNDLKTEPIKDDVDFNNMPDQMGSYGPMLQPGNYRFRMSKLGPDNFDAVDSEQGQRLKVKFDQNAPLVVVQAVDQQMIGETYRTSLTNIARKRGKKDDPNAKFASDLDFLFQALGETTRPTSNKGFADVLIAKSNAAAEFSATNEWSYRCGEQSNARWLQEDGSLAEGAGPDGQPLKGCGTRVYQKDVQKVDGKYPERITCAGCGASVRAFGNLSNFKA